MIKVLFAGTLPQKNDAGHFGGIYTFCENLLDSTLKQKVNLVFCDTSAGNIKFSERGAWKVSNFYDAFINIMRFTRLLLATRPDIVYINTAYGPSFLKHGVMALITMWMGAKVVIQPHCSIEKIISNEKSAIKEFALFIFRHCAGVLVLSKEWLILEEQVNCPVRYIPNSINLQPYLSLSRYEKAPEHLRRNILYLGHLGYDKGTFDLIEAIGFLAPRLGATFSLSLVGEAIAASEMPGIMDLVIQKKVTDWLTIYPPKFAQQKITAFANADILVLPSHHEGMPMTIIEAMAAALPVVATQTGGIPDLVIPGETGILVPVSEPLELAGALEILLVRDDLRYQFGQAARSRAQQLFDINIRADEIAEFFEQIVHPAGAASSMD